MRVYRIVLLLFMSLLVSCSNKPSAPPAQSGSECLRIVAQNRLEEFKLRKSECLLHRSDHGTTPLMLATARGHLEMMSELIDAGADVNEVDKLGDTAIHYAVATNRLQAAQLLMKRGARVVSQREDGISGLMQAVQIGSFDMIKTLTADREALNQPADDGWTALYFAIRRADPQILTWLLEHGACINTFDTYRQTPLQFAQEVKWKVGENILTKAVPCGEKK